ncbi:SGNH/GDSL hydrolase family protein [Microbacterium excoecariae]|uniref:SGNH/GDSL hydrolase family protein n=1 Tax=Microbacterium excoecariae TaxID=2715210 RepID=UPI0014072C1F|nr:SGNH/GDSL hydrolase family protein [Microbacterium excoecariae]NHI16373.1 SGNH/GDSL hydrolase family protein [Microbacterium excoecariae]
MPRTAARLAALAATVAAVAATAACSPAGTGATAAADGRELSGDGSPALLVFGDSWTNGMAATSAENRYAALTGEALGWKTTVDGENGSGYLHEGSAGGTYGSRLARLAATDDFDVIVIQGSINDRKDALAGLDGAAEAVWDGFAERFPDAEIVVLGPAPHVLPVEEKIERIDEILARAAAADGLTYVSPLADEWITPANYDTVIDTSEQGANHPGDAGHAYLAEVLADDLAALFPDLVAVPVEAAR